MSTIKKWVFGMGLQRAFWLLKQSDLLDKGQWPELLGPCICVVEVVKKKKGSESVEVARQRFIVLIRVKDGIKLWLKFNKPGSSISVLSYDANWGRE